MAAVKISYVVSSSQDPRYPVENLLLEDRLRPWLSCPQDRSRQLRLELQLERASPIGYVDVGNCGCPLNQPYLTLVPSVGLMTPADSKLDQNRCRVRMFKEADFLVLAVGQKWDRLRLTCSQPFSKHSQFGLSFIRVRTLLDPEDIQPPPSFTAKPSRSCLNCLGHSLVLQEDPEPADSPWRSSPAFCWTFFPNPCSYVARSGPSPSLPCATRPGATLRCCLQAPRCLELWLLPACLLSPPHRADCLPPGAQGRRSS
uniref:DNA-repair protein Xrcc1 N-terminal domain-containing protein n=1 Tax=Falco tinnunculus TaxID=100819 RepID=A0A8C4UR89_FALTI